MIKGTSNFATLEGAVKYYKQYGSDKQEVLRKIQDKEIQIGKPSICPGETLHLDPKEGRYFIKYADKIKFVAIDAFNRPIFKSVYNKWYFGSCDILFPYGESEKEVLKKVSEKDLLYFGNSFGCEPMGYKTGDIQIIKETENDF